MDVSLNPWEFKACVDVANQRMVVSETAGMNHSSTYRRDHLTRIQQEITGACGEMAVCKALGKFWSPSVNTFHDVPDIDPNIEVRTTDRENGSLIVRDNDPEDRWYFLVTGVPPLMRVVGAIRGGDAKRDEWVRDPHGHRPAWFVPQEALKKG
jgi:hypothetical protein